MGRGNTDNKKSKKQRAPKVKEEAVNHFPPQTLMARYYDPLNPQDGMIVPFDAGVGEEETLKGMLNAPGALSADLVFVGQYELVKAFRVERKVDVVEI